ncbi:MAG: insulinase family protein [Bacteroidales bacterium]|nr:insulinase family protein [Bacteroidales bacterium]
MLQPPSLQHLVPDSHPLPNGNTLYSFVNPNIELVKVDITLEAGSVYQQKKSLAHAANQLFGEATARHTASEIAEFLDFRGIVVERLSDVCVSNISFYFHRKYAAELFPVIREMFDNPVITPEMFEAYKSHRRQQIEMGFQQTNFTARNLFYECLYGFDHPLGTYAKASDLDLLTIDDVSSFIKERFILPAAHLVLSGQVDDGLLRLADDCLSPSAPLQTYAPVVLSNPEHHGPFQPAHYSLPEAVQSTIRIGRVLPMSWDSPDYARFMLLNTVLGGYFGSRLMSNIREDKGYTYGIYSTTQIFRGSIVFYITADVASEATRPAVKEVFAEIERLQAEPVTDEEMDRVRNYMMGDFIRSIDGVFEVSERYRQMVATHVTEQQATNLLDAIANVTPKQLQDLACRYLTNLLVVTAGSALDPQ